MGIWEAKTDRFFATSMSGIRDILHVVWTFLFEAFELTIGFIYSREFIDIVLPNKLSRSHEIDLPVDFFGVPRRLHLQSP